MATFCTKCGTEIPEGTRGCPACGEGSIARIVLTGASGTMSSGIDLDFGRIHAGRICGEEARFVDEKQFTLRKGSESWVITPNLAVQNETFVNGTAITGDTALNEGDEISLKGKAAFIKVSYS